MVDNQDDCNDEDLKINPLAIEVCDNVDNDCDRFVDDEDDSLETATTYYADGDGDGFGDINQSTYALCFAYRIC